MDLPDLFLDTEQLAGKTHFGWNGLATNYPCPYSLNQDDCLLRTSQLPQRMGFLQSADDPLHVTHDNFGDSSTASSALFERSGNNLWNRWHNELHQPNQEYNNYDAIWTADEVMKHRDTAQLNTVFDIESVNEFLGVMNSRRVMAQDFKEETFNQICTEDYTDTPINRNNKVCQVPTGDRCRHLPDYSAHNLEEVDHNFSSDETASTKTEEDCGETLSTNYQTISGVANEELNPSGYSNEIGRSGLQSSQEDKAKGTYDQHSYAAPLDIQESLRSLGCTSVTRNVAKGKDKQVCPKEVIPYSHKKETERHVRTTERQIEENIRKARMHAEKKERQRILAEMEERKAAAIQERRDERNERLERARHRRYAKEQRKEQIRERKELQSCKEGFLKAEQERRAHLNRWQEKDDERERVTLIRRWMVEAGFPLQGAPTMVDSFRTNGIACVDSSLRFDNDREQQDTTEPNRGHLPAVPYDILNDPRMEMTKKRLRALLKFHKLSSKGTKIELVRRVHDYYDSMASSSLRSLLETKGVLGTGGKESLLLSIAWLEKDFSE